jgi:hypothetical protein
MQQIEDEKLAAGTDIQTIQLDVFFPPVLLESWERVKKLEKKKKGWRGLCRQLAIEGSWQSRAGLACAGTGDILLLG